MDATILDIKKGDSLPSKDFVIRTVEASKRDKKNNQIPAPRCFTLSDDDKSTDYGLSVDWSELTTAEDILIRVGLSKKKGKEVYKDYTTRELYSMNVGFLKSFSEITNVVYDPKDFNVAHSLILFKPESYEQAEPEIVATKIRDHAKDNKVLVNMQVVREKVELGRI